MAVSYGRNTNLLYHEHVHTHVYTHVHTHVSTHVSTHTSTHTRTHLRPHSPNCAWPCIPVARTQSCDTLSGGLQWAPSSPPKVELAHLVICRRASVIFGRVHSTALENPQIDTEFLNPPFLMPHSVDGTVRASISIAGSDESFELLGRINVYTHACTHACTRV